MPLENAQYEDLMRVYDLRRQAALKTQLAHTEEVHRDHPEIRAIDEAIRDAGLIAAKKKVLDPGYDASHVRAEIDALSHSRRAALAAAGYPADYLEPAFTCPICKDTGYVNGRKCVCFHEEELRLLYDRYHLGDVLEKENFAHFSFDWYSDTIIDEKTGRTARETAQIAYAAARRIADGIGKENNNLFLHGKVGLGKTFLTHCIAKDALDRSFSVLYFSAPKLFSLLAEDAFGRGGVPEFRSRIVPSCDLLIIDDLGTELVNSFTASELFHLVSERLAEKRTTVISTNLTLEEFRDRYSDRLYSRVIRHFTILKLIGTDIRLLTRLKGGQP